MQDVLENPEDFKSGRRIQGIQAECADPALAKSNNNISAAIQLAWKKDTIKALLVI